MLQLPAHSLRADLARVLRQTIGPGRIVIAGRVNPEMRREFEQFGVEMTVCTSAEELRALFLQNGQPASSITAVWIYANDAADDGSLVSELARVGETVVLLPAAGTDVAKLRPRLVAHFGRCGFVPDYAADLTELDRGAIRLVQGSESALVPAVERAIARQNERVRALERSLRTRMSELEAADRHIAKLEEKLLALKEARRALKQLKQEKQALRKSPERKIGQVLLAPYRLPQKLVRAVRKRRQKSGIAEPMQTVGSAAEYQAWFARHRATPAQLESMRAEARTFENAPVISIITPVFNTPVSRLEQAIDSVRTQVYERWELILIDDASPDESTAAALGAQAARDPRLRVLRMEQHGGISVASNRGLSVATGEWIALLDHDDLLEPDALFHIAKLLQQHPAADLIYSDEDKLTESGLDAPFLKPDWSPDYFLSCNYLQHFTAIRHRLVRELGGFRPEYDFAQDYDLFLRVVTRTDRIHHIPRVLYHWRKAEGSTANDIRDKPETLDAARRALTDHLARRGERGHVAVDWRTHTFQIRRDLVAEKKVAIIIPMRDRIDLLARCIASVEAKTAYKNYEIVVVDNDSQSAEAREYFRAFPHRLLRFSGPFNFSAINNYAVERTDAAWLLFLNNDTEVIDAEWLTIMAEHVQRPEVGAVGARLLYRDETIQHAGVVVGVRGLAKHAFCGFPAESPGVQRQLQLTRNYSAVTAACLLTRREVFAEVGGFDEERLPVVFNDTDLCLKMRQAGYLIVYTPFAKLYHDESASRRANIVEPIEGAVLQERWPQILARDPYYNPNLSRERADFSLGE